MHIPKNTWNSSQYRVFVGCIASIFAIIACSDDPLVLNEFDQPSQDVEYQEVSPVDTGVDAETNLDEDAVSSPDANSTPEICDEREEASFPAYFYDNSQCTGPWDSGGSIGYWGRQHMDPDVILNWLSPDEYFVLDGFWCQYGESSLQPEYKISAFHQGRPLPIRLAHVPEPSCYPTLEEIQEWDEDSFDDEIIITRENDISFNYTIAIPPWAFPEEGAYNIQIIGTPIWEPSMDEWILHSRFPHHNAQTVYYGSEEWLDAEPEIPNRQSELEPGQFEGFGASFLNRTVGFFLAPPLDVYDWSALTDIAESELNEVLSLSSPEVTLTLHLRGTEGSTPDIRPRGLYYVRQDGEIIEMFTIEPGEVEPGSDDPGHILPIDVEVGEDISAIDIIGMPRGHLPYVDVELAIKESSPLTSNTLLLQYKPE